MSIQQSLFIFIMIAMYLIYPNSQIYLIIIILIGLFSYPMIITERFNSSLNMPDYGANDEISPSYSSLNYNIAQGNQLSWSDQPNPYLDSNLRGPQDPITYMGTPMPLSYEDNPTTPIPIKDSMYQFSNYACKPECCLYSPFSCSNGCVCWQAPPEKFNGLENNKITPSS